MEAASVSARVSVRHAGRQLFLSNGHPASDAPRAVCAGGTTGSRRASVQEACNRRRRALMKPVIGLMLGDVTGIGPELAVKLLAAPATREAAHVVVVGDRRVLELG